jgi:hypothetical protein
MQQLFQIFVQVAHNDIPLLLQFSQAGGTSRLPETPFYLYSHVQHQVEHRNIPRV